jgi:CRP-like cAMP-binding protein
LALSSDAALAYGQAMTERRDLAASLATTWFGAELSPHARAAFLDLARVAELTPETEMTREGELTTEFGLVLSGRVALRLVVPGRGRTTILTVEPGDVVGWSAVVPPYRATSTAVTVGPVRALLVEAVALRAALRADDALAASLYPRLLDTMARRLQGTRLQLLDLFSGQMEGAW